jgi:rod shape-determining protein MreD
MGRSIIVNILRFIFLVFIQVFLLKNITLYSFSTPYLYILFILLLPFETPNLLLFPLAFILGLTIDAFYDTPGLHAASCVLLTLFHHFFLFNLEVFRFSEIQYTLTRIVLSSIFTVFLMLISGLLFYRSKERK